MNVTDKVDIESDVAVEAASNSSNNNTEGSAQVDEKHQPTTPTEKGSPPLAPQPVWLNPITRVLSGWFGNGPTKGAQGGEPHSPKPDLADVATSNPITGGGGGGEETKYSEEAVEPPPLKKPGSQNEKEVSSGQSVDHHYDHESFGRPSEGVTLSDFDRIKVLGKGSFGKVVLVEKQGSTSRYAMKVLKKSKLRRAKQVERTKTERRVLEICEGHPFIMSMFYAFQTAEKLYIVLEYCSGGELFFHLSRFRKFPEHVARFYAAELICALEFLHKHGVIYRDMKPENVLLDAEGHVKLGDFGLAKDNIWDPCSGGKSICGTPEYMAPEVLNKVGHGQAVDWWGLGMILYEMLTGLPPWYTKDRQKLFQRLRYAPLRIPPTMTIECASLVSAFLCRTPIDRLGARGTQAIKDHPFFRPDVPRVSSVDGQRSGQEEEDDEGNANSSKKIVFNWPDLESRALKPPIDPMEGIPMSADDRDNTANFDPQFTRLEVETDNEEEAPEKFEHFEGFSYMGSGDLEVGSGDDDGVLDDDIKPSEDGELGVGAGGVTLKVPPRKRGSEDDAHQVGDVFIDPRPLGVEAMGDVIRKLSEASYSQPASRDTSAPSSHQSSMDSVLGLPPPPPPNYPHPDDLAMQLTDALIMSQSAGGGVGPASPYDLVDNLDHPPPQQQSTNMVHNESPLDLFVTCKGCGARVQQTVDAIDAHVCDENYSKSF